MMSTLNTLLQVWGKMLYLPIWHQNLLGKIWCQNIGYWGEGRHPWEVHTYPKEEFWAPFYLGGSTEWVCGVDGVLDHCKRRSNMSYSTPSQMWGSWYLLSFLGKVGSLTLMFMASLMVLVIPYDSLSIMNKCSNLMKCSAVWEWPKMGEGALRCSLNLSPKFLPVSPMYSMVHPGWSHLYL